MELDRHEMAKQDAVAALYQNSRFEVIPLKSLMTKLDALPNGASLTLTCSANKSIEHSLDYIETLLQHPAKPKLTPHIAARMIQNEPHLDALLNRLEALQIQDVFLPAGDITDPEGCYETALDVLKTLSRKPHHLNQIGITGYPEGHMDIPENILWENLQAKANYADYIVTQLCFDPEKIIHWIEMLRKNDIWLPIYIGIPGMLDRKKLLEISLRLGIGASIRFLKRGTGIFSQLFSLKPLESAAQLLTEQLVDTLSKTDLNVRGFHVYTFNQIEPTFTWWNKYTNDSRE